MKKFFTALTFALAVAIFLPSMNCEALDYYVGNYDDGSKAYLMTDTIKKVVTGEEWHNGRKYYAFEYECTIKAVYSNSSIIHISYVVIPDPELWIVKDGKRFTRDEMKRIWNNHNSVEYRIYDYLKNEYKFTC